MNLLTLLLLAVLAFFFLQEGMSFIGFLFIIAIALVFLTQVLGKAKPGGHAHKTGPHAGRVLTGPIGGAGEGLMGGGTLTSGARGIVIEEEEPEIPPNIDIKIKPNWEANTLFEDIFAADGEILDVVGRSVKKFVTGGERPRRHGEEPPEGGR